MSQYKAFTDNFVICFLSNICCVLSSCSWITLMWMRPWKVMTVRLRFGTSAKTLWGNTRCRLALLPSRTHGCETSESCSSDIACLLGVSGTKYFLCLVLTFLGVFYSIYNAIFYFKLLCSGPPDFDEILANCTAELGQTVKLACKATGVPKPVITWYKGMELKKKSSNFLT